MGADHSHIMCKVGYRLKCPLSPMLKRMGAREGRGHMVVYLCRYTPTQVDIWQREKSLLREIISKNIIKFLILLPRMKMGWFG